MKAIKKNKIIVAPLNWGWGHVSRCIPIIREIQKLNFIPVVACDGDALLFLKKEFPSIETIELTGYRIKYGSYFKLRMLLNLPHIIYGIWKEHKEINHYISQRSKEVAGLISDNRLGVYSSKVKSAYITHQLNIKAGLLSVLVNKVHHYFIKKHNVCWVPDEPCNLYTGELSKNENLEFRYIGILSRFEKSVTTKKYDLLVLLSGVEGQRVILERILLEELKHYQGKVLFVRGSFKKLDQQVSDHIQLVDYMNSEDLEKAILSADMILSRSGYSTVMDLIKLEKKAFLIPTPGQTEQEYLASYLKKKQLFDYCHQKDFTIDRIQNRKDVCRFNQNHKHLLKEELDAFVKLFQA
ncbi:glycosyltransferase [Wenyingzhuangia sp. IMCC45533]